MDEDAVERVSDLLYEAAAISEAWPKALAALARAAGAASAHFVLWSRFENRARFAAVSNPDPACEARYTGYYLGIDPSRQLLESRPVGEWVASHRHFDSAFVRRSEYFNDFLLPIGGRYSAKSRIFEAKADRVHAVAGVLRGPKAGPFSDQEVDRLAAALGPHLHRAAALHHRLAPVLAKGRLLEAAVDRITFGLMAVDAAGRILVANSAAQEMLEAGDGLLVRNGALRAFRPDQSERLSKTIAACTAQQGHGDAVHVSRRRERVGYTIMVAPLPEAVDLPSMGGDRAALLLISDPERDGSAGLARALRGAYGLTEAEARLAALVGLGAGPQEAADRLALAVGTVRFTLKRIFTKLDISRQSELATMVARIATLMPGDDRHCAQHMMSKSSLALRPATDSRPTQSPSEPSVGTVRPNKLDRPGFVGRVRSPGSP